MTLTSSASALAILLFACAMVHVVATDLVHRRIRNWLVGALVAAYLPLAFAAGLSGAQIAASLVAAALFFAACLGCFAAGWIGGGDAKLAPACVLWLGAGQALPFLLLTALFGGLLALAAVAHGALRRRPAAVVGDAPRTPQLTLPYGPALAAAGLALLRNSPWAHAL